MRFARPVTIGALFGLLLAVHSTAFAQETAVSEKSALDEYVAQPDSAYQWRVVREIPHDGATTFVVDLVSQRWRTRRDVDRPLWKHWLVIVKPDRVTSNKAFVLIGGGRNGREAPEKPSDRIAAIAKATGSVVAELGQIPNQPLVFNGDGAERTEDDLIGYAWDQFMKTGDPTWAPRLPMTKSVARAMDTIQELLASKQGGEVQIDEFVVAGGSKRGWTTWITGAVDDRVAAIIPIVIDVLNVKQSMRHHYGAYGFWAPAIDDYVNHHINERMETPESNALMALVDPYSYRERYTMPKFIVNAAGDQFFLPDSSQFYFHELPGEKYLRYVPNADHGLDNSDALESIIAFYHAILTDSPRPKFSWTMQDDGSIRVETEDRPREVRLWHATNPSARDFRLETFGPGYQSEPLEDQGDGVYVGRVDQPAKGWTAYFVELTFESDGPYPFKFTTDVRVVPNHLPYADQVDAAVGKK